MKPEMGEWSGDEGDKDDLDIDRSIGDNPGVTDPGWMNLQGDESEVDDIEVGEVEVGEPGIEAAWVDELEGDVLGVDDLGSWKPEVDEATIALRFRIIRWNRKVFCSSFKTSSGLIFAATHRS